MKRFKDIDLIKIGNLRPGIVEEATAFEQGETFRSRDIATDYRSNRKNYSLAALKEAGLLETVNYSDSISTYRIVENLEPAEDMAEVSFRVKILENLDSLGIKALNPAEDIKEKGLTDNPRENALIRYRNNDYHEDTVKFLSDLCIIEDQEDRTYVSHPKDREYIVENSTEWVEIAEHLSENHELPKKHRQEIEAYNKMFGASLPYRTSD